MFTEYIWEVTTVTPMMRMDKRKNSLRTFDINARRAEMIN